MRSILSLSLWMNEFPYMKLQLCCYANMGTCANGGIISSTVPSARTMFPPASRGHESPSRGRTGYNHEGGFWNRPLPTFRRRTPGGPLEDPYCVIPSLHLTWNTKTPAIARLSTRLSPACTQPSVTGPQTGTPQGWVLCSLRFHELTLWWSSKLKLQSVHMGEDLTWTLSSSSSAGCTTVCC